MVPLPCAIVEEVARARGFVVNNELYVFKTFLDQKFQLL